MDQIGRKWFLKQICQEMDELAKYCKQHCEDEQRSCQHKWKWTIELLEIDWGFII